MKYICMEDNADLVCYDDGNDDDGSKIDFFKCPVCGKIAVIIYDKENNVTMVDANKPVRLQQSPPEIMTVEDVYNLIKDVKEKINNDDYKDIEIVINDSETLMGVDMRTHAGYWYTVGLLEEMMMDRLSYRDFNTPLIINNKVLLKSSWSLSYNDNCPTLHVNAINLPINAVHFN